MTDRKATSIRLSAEADRLLDLLNEHLGFKSRSAVLELAVRKLAERERIMGTTRRDFFQHIPSGDVYAAEYQGQTITAVCGPLHWREVITAHLADFDYSTEDAAWLDGEDHRLLTEPEISQKRNARAEDEDA